MVHNLPFVYVNKVLLDHSHAPLMYVLHMAALASTRIGQDLHRDCMARKLKIIYCLDFYQKKFAAPG